MLSRKRGIRQVGDGWRNADAAACQHWRVTAKNDRIQLYETTAPILLLGSRRLCAENIRTFCPDPRTDGRTDERAAGGRSSTLVVPYQSWSHWRRQGGPRGPGPPIAGPKIFLSVKTEGLSSLPPAKSGRACYDNPTGRGHFYQMPNMYTCIAYLIENRKFCSKNLVYKGVNFEAQNALKLTNEHL